MTFEQLNIIKPILEAVEQEGYLTPSPIQGQAIPVLLEGKDMLASAQTGTGKTAAFAIPIIQGIYNNRDHNTRLHDIKALILAPTRELAEQIKDSFRNYSRNLNIRTEVVYGGVSQRGQEKALNRGVDVLIATPGRLLDLLGQKLIDLSKVAYFVLDEADRMLDMGFVHDVRRVVVSIPKTRQTALFSATIPKEILKLADELLNNPVRIEVTPPEAMVDKIKQSVFHVTKKDKINLLLDLLVDPKLASVLVFTRTKHGANKLVKDLVAYGVKVNAIHGNKSQNQRQQALEDFKKKKLRVLVATDIAARGIDIDELSHVINYDLPETAETYVHRMGRTGRAGLSGEAYSFCSQDENSLLVAIEKHIKMALPVNEKHDYHVSIRLNAESNIPVKKPSSSTKNTNRSGYNANKQTGTRDAYKRYDQPSRKPKTDKKTDSEPLARFRKEYIAKEANADDQFKFGNKKKRVTPSKSTFNSPKPSNNKNHRRFDEDKPISERNSKIQDTYFKSTKKSNRGL